MCLQTMSDYPRGGYRTMKSAIASPAGDGRIPFTLRIGVTGHRQLEDPVSLVPAIRDAVSQLKALVPGSAQFPESQPLLVVVSALAEGADRLVADVVLAEPGAAVEAALPLPVEDYLDDFESAESKAQFMELLHRASTVWHAAAAASRDEAYELAGHYVVDRCDAMIALWDGEPGRGRGGTAAIVDYARRLGVPLVRVTTKGPPSAVAELGTPRADVIQQAARQLREYNASAISPAEFARQAGSERARLMPEITAGGDAGPVSRSMVQVADWLIPYFIRADVLATRLQRRFRALNSAMFVMAAAAVAVVAIQANFLADQNWLVLIEVVLLLFLLSIPRVSRRGRLHDRWISYRFLAERLRSAYFLTLAGTGDQRERSARLAYLSDSSEAWIERALTEVVVRRPEMDIGQPDVAFLRGYLSQYWIGGQICYHKKAARRHRAWDERIIRATGLLFGITLVAAVLHTLGFGENGGHRSHWATLLIVLSISVPAIGAAVHGIGTQRQFRRHSQRYLRMAGLLRQLQAQMGQADTLDRVQQIAAETERIMREENSDWFGVMRFYDMELIT
jgi:hypothetical protein